MTRIGYVIERCVLNTTFVDFQQSCEFFENPNFFNYEETLYNRAQISGGFSFILKYESVCQLGEDLSGLRRVVSSLHRSHLPADRAVSPPRSRPTPNPVAGTAMPVVGGKHHRRHAAATPVLVVSVSSNSHNVSTHKKVVDKVIYSF